MTCGNCFPFRRIGSHRPAWRFSGGTMCFFDASEVSSSNRLLPEASRVGGSIVDSSAAAADLANGDAVESLAGLPLPLRLCAILPSGGVTLPVELRRLASAPCEAFGREVGSFFALWVCPRRVLTRLFLRFAFRQSDRFP